MQPTPCLPALVSHHRRGSLLQADDHPGSGTITASRIANMMELRPASAGRSKIRILLVSAPWRSVALLVAGRKSGQWAKCGYRDAR